MQSAVVPDAHGIGVLLLIAVALWLFTRDRIPIESSSLSVLIVLVTTFYLFPYEREGVALEPRDFFAGFGNEALVAVCALIILGKALETTGALQPVATLVSGMWRARPMIATLLMLGTVAAMSGFVNDTPIVVLMIPIIAGIARRASVPVSRLMLPMGFATIVGGMATTIGTSTNLLVVLIAENLGLPRIGMFDFFVPAAAVGSLGLLYVWLVLPRWLPVRALPLADVPERLYAAQLMIGEMSPADGMTLSEVLAHTDNSVKLRRIRRGDSLYLAKLPTLQLHKGDRLQVTGTAYGLKQLERRLGATLQFAAANDSSEDQPDTDAFGRQLAEMVITRSSPLHRRTLNEAGFVTRYGLLPLAIHRPSVATTRLSGDPREILLRAGDLLLLQGTAEAIDAVRNSGEFLILDGSMHLPATHRARRALAVMVFVVGSAALGLLPIAVSALIGVGLMMLLRCISWHQVSDSLPVPVIMIIVTSLALGKALVGTGMAVYLAHGFVGLADGLPPAIILSAFLLIVAVMTNIVSNNAAAVIGTPIAIATAEQLAVNPLPFVLAVLFGANMSFATPFGYQTNLLIMGAAGYRFRDFLRAGVPLILILWAGFSLLLPRYYGLATPP